jgi:hypothetical protein
MVTYATHRYSDFTGESSTIVNQLINKYKEEGWNMPYTMQDFKRDVVRTHLGSLSTEEVLKLYSTEEVLKQYSPEEVLKLYSTEEVLKQYSPEEVLKQYSAEDRLKGLSIEEIQRYLESKQKK